MCLIRILLNLVKVITCLGAIQVHESFYLASWGAIGVTLATFITTYTSNVQSRGETQPKRNWQPCKKVSTKHNNLGAIVESLQWTYQWYALYLHIPGAWWMIGGDLTCPNSNKPPYLGHNLAYHPPIVCDREIWVSMKFIRNFPKTREHKEREYM